MPPEPSSPFQTPAFNEAGEDMLNWTQDWQRRRRQAALAAAQNDADTGDSGDDTFSGGDSQYVLADKTGADDLTGQIVVLPDGSKVADSSSWTGYMMSPVADLSHVAAAGRAIGLSLGLPMRTTMPPVVASPMFYGNLFLHLHHGGTFDYQRRGNPITGYTEFPQYRNVSNFNVGLYGQQAGLSLDETKLLAGAYARLFSKNANPKNPYGLDADTAKFIEHGYDAGRSGTFNQPATR